jgi:hypothetical protein
MKYSVPVLVLLASSLVSAQSPNKNPNKNEPPMLGPHLTRDEAAKQASQAPQAHKRGDLLYHGGSILPSVTTQAVFWGKTWGTYTGDKISGMDKWYSGIGTVSGGAGSSYEATTNEWTDKAGERVSSAITYGGHIVDATALPVNLSSTAILNEVCKVIPKPVANGYYPVYVDKKRGGAGYCAYHSYGACSGTPVEFGFFFNLDGDGGCDPKSTVSGESQGLAALANVSGHEMSETRSDPRGAGWYSPTGNENGDNCAWTFGGAYVTFLDGTHWKMQGEWSDAANDGTSPNGPGYTTTLGTGCVDGSNYKGPYTQ